MTHPERDKEKDEEKEDVPLVRTLCSSCPVFLRTLSGRTVVMTVADCSTSELLQRIEEVTQIPQQYWYCHVNGSPLPQGSAPHGLHRDCTVVMCARLKGGAPTIPGEWFCQVCQRGGCWPARTHCFRRGCKKGRKHFAASQVIASCPTERRPTPQQGSRKPPNAKLSQQVVLEALRSMGLPLELMQQLQDTLAPPALPEKPAKRLLDLQIKLDKVQQEADRLASVVSKKQEELMQAEVRHDSKKEEVQQVLAAIDRVKVEMDMPAPPLVEVAGGENVMEAPAFEEMDDDVFLGLNHQHFPDLEGVSEGGDPPGSSKRPRQCLESAVMSSAPSFDTTVHAIANLDADEIQQLLQVAQMQLDTKSAASQLCG